MNKYILIDSNIVIDIVRAGILYIEFKKKKNLEFLIDEWSIYSLVVTGYVFFFFFEIFRNLTSTIRPSRIALTEEISS